MEDQKTDRLVQLSMVCTCKKDELDEAQDCITKYMQTSEYQDIENPTGLVTGIVNELNWEYNAYIRRISTDQWFGVFVRQWLEKEVINVYCECDRVEDGLVKILSWLEANNPETRHDIRNKLAAERNCLPYDVPWKDVPSDNKW